VADLASLLGAQVRAFAPEVLVVAGGAGGPAGAVSELAALPGWWGLPAVKAGCVYIVDAALLLRAGPRIVRALGPLFPPFLNHLLYYLHSTYLCIFV
jgi:ABC-type Fe3+-hydroxamate transport system substrate-binding protein